MKKIFVLAIIALATVSNSFALDLNEYKVFYKLNNEKTFNSLSRYLGTSSAQEEQLKYVFTETERKMKSAVGSENDAAAIGFARLPLSPCSCCLAPVALSQAQHAAGTAPILRLASSRTGER